MESEHRPWRRQHEAFWRAHHEAWKRSDLYQRQYCEAHGLPRKAFENWRAQFRTEPQPAAPKLLYWRGGVSHALSHNPSHTLGHVTYPSSEHPVVAPLRDGHRRRFTETDKQRILKEATRKDASLSEISRRHGIARRAVSMEAGIDRPYLCHGSDYRCAICEGDWWGECTMMLLPAGVKVHLALGYTDMM